MLLISSALATPAGEIDGQMDELEARSGELDSDYRQALANLVAVDTEVNRYNAEIQTAAQRRGGIEAEIQASQLQLDQLRSELGDRQAVLEKRLLSTYKSDDIGYLDVVMGAGDFSDFLNRVDMMNIIAEDDRRLILSIQDSQNSVERHLASLSGMEDELATLIDGLSSAQQNLLSAQAEQQQVVSDLSAQMQNNQAQLDQLQAEAAAIESRMSQIQSQASYSEPAGGGQATPPAAGGSTYTMTATAYCLSGTTASGMPVGRGIIAVDPRVIALGSRVHVSGYGDAIAADTGGVIHGDKIDVWLPCGEAYAWGVRTVTVTVY